MYRSFLVLYDNVRLSAVEAFFYHFKYNSTALNVTTAVIYGKDRLLLSR